MSFLFFSLRIIHNVFIPFKEQCHQRRTCASSRGPLQFQTLASFYPSPPSFSHLLKQRLTFIKEKGFFISNFLSAPACERKLGNVSFCPIKPSNQRGDVSHYMRLYLFSYNQKHPHCATLQGYMASESVCLIFIITKTQPLQYV